VHVGLGINKPIEVDCLPLEEGKMDGHTGARERNGNDGSYEDH
jgi:hypothetical protein